MAKSNLTKKRPEKSQIEKFRDKARELGCDEDEGQFAAALKRVASSPSSAVKKSK
jgi:hypothetical protein